jgi:hypothetical protein
MKASQTLYKITADSPGSEAAGKLAAVLMGRHGVQCRQVILLHNRCYSNRLDEFS